MPLSLKTSPTEAQLLSYAAVADDGGDDDGDMSLIETISQTNNQATYYHSLDLYSFFISILIISAF